MYNRLSQLSRDDEGMVDTGQVAFVPGHAEPSTEDLQRRAAPEDGPGGCRELRMVVSW